MFQNEIPPNVTNDPLIGQHIGTYQIIQLLKEGAFGSIYIAYQTNLGRKVAFKIIPTNFKENDLAVPERDTLAMAALEHPNIVPVHDFGVIKGNGTQTYYIVMRLLNGGTLQEKIIAANQSKNSLSLKEISGWIRDIASALDYAHTKGFIHRDIKGTNIIFDQFNNPFLTDFGSIPLIGFDQRQPIGTPAYMSPEQFDENYVTAISPASDEYSLAIMAYELIAGRPPFVNAEFIELVRQHKYDPIPAIQSFRPEAPEALNSVFQRALAKYPPERYPSATTFAEALEDALHYMGKKLRVFISYSTKNLAEVEMLVSRLEESSHSVWYDRELKNTGGQSWWDNILRQIYNCDLFVFALTSDLLLSYPCQLEYTYAHQLHKFILPVMLKKVDVNILPTALASLQVIDFTLPDGYLTLKNSIDNLPMNQPMPDPLPEPPMVPVSELNKLSEQIDLPDLTDDEQLLIAAKIEDLLDLPPMQEGAKILLLKFHNRHNLASVARRKIEKLLKEIN